jgi:hypothetical protein
MAVFTQPYREVLGESYPVPLIDLILLGPSGRIPVLAMLDSGANRPIFPLKAAQEAGIDLTKSPGYWVQYGGSITNGWIVRARLELVTVDAKPDMNIVLDTSIVFVEEFGFPYALLGRIGFFDRFNEVAFAQRASPARFELRY